MMDGTESGSLEASEPSPNCEGKCTTTTFTADVIAFQSQIQTTETSDLPLRKQKQDKISPERKKYIKYQSPGKSGDMRHQLLVQRTFSPHDGKPGPRTSSPMREVHGFKETCGCSPIRCSPSSVQRNTRQLSQQSNKIVPFVSPHSDNVLTPSDVQAIFKTPIRAQHSNTDHKGFSTPSRETLALYSSPAGSSASVLTPGRHFINPFEIDNERVHVPAFSPSIFHIESACSSAHKNESEAFWSVEQMALLKPVTIKETDVHRQMHHQHRIDREQDEKVQSAINVFFSNELIVPSPWSEKVNHFLPRTPGSTKSVSCQTTLSVPSEVDLLAELGGKYELPEYLADPSPVVESLGNSFIRRKLLNQLNDNDNEILASPALPMRSQEKCSSPSPPSKKQSTPEWEQQTPNKLSSGHFSSSPIREEPGEKGQYPAMSESELLASPELSPVAGSGQSRFSGMFYSDQDMENSRAMMQLDFSSILEDGSGGEEETMDKPGTIMQQTVTESQPVAELSNSLLIHADLQLQASSTSSQDGETIPPAQTSPQRPLLYSAISVGSNPDNVSGGTSGAQLGSSQDTGYYTATSLLQSTTNLAMSTSSSLPIEAGLASLPDPWNISGRLASDVDLKEFIGVKHKSDIGSEIRSLNSGTEQLGKGLGLSFAKDEPIPQRKREPCLVRKIRALSDVRLTREKRSVSRDLTHSFNLDCSAKSDELRRSFGDTENVISRSSSRGKLEGMDTCEPLDISMRSVNSADLSSSHTKLGAAVWSASIQEISSSYKQQSSDNSSRALDTSGSNFQSRFSLGDDNTLEQARQVLGKSVELRQRHLQLESSLNNSDPFQLALMGSDENRHPACLTPAMKSGTFDPDTLGRNIRQLEDSPTTPRILERIERNINSVQSSRLGSEIAAEILKRAGDDLAKVTDVLEENSPQHG